MLVEVPQRLEYYCILVFWFSGMMVNYERVASYGIMIGYGIIKMIIDDYCGIMVTSEGPLMAL